MPTCVAHIHTTLKQAAEPQNDLKRGGAKIGPSAVLGAVLPNTTLLGTRQTQRG